MHACKTHDKYFYTQEHSFQRYKKVARRIKREILKQWWVIFSKFPSPGDRKIESESVRIKVLLA